MKRHTFLAAMAITSFVAVPAMAHTPIRDHRAKLKVRPAQVVPTITSYGPAKGAPGTVVTVRGKNFAGGTQIKLGNTIITPHYVTSQVIKFRIPKNGIDGALSLKSPRLARWYRVGSFNVIKPKPAYSETRFKRAFVASAGVKAENDYHSQQIQRYKRLLKLSIAYQFTDLTYHINRSIKIENQRHRAEMAKLEREFRAAWNNRYRRPAPKKSTWSAKATYSLNLSLL